MAPVRARPGSGGHASKPEFLAAAERWKSLSTQARLADPQLAGTARALDAAKRLIQLRDRRLSANLGTNLAPGGDYVSSQITANLEAMSLPARLARKGPLPSRSSADLAPGAKGSMLLFAEIRDAAYRARNARQKEALDYFTSAEGGGWTKEQAAGIVASLTIESNLDPEKHQHRTKKLGYGLAQWELGKERAADFARFARRPLKGSSFEQQLAFINYELMRSRVYKRAGDALRRARTVDDAVRLFALAYEGMREKIAQPRERASYAIAVYKEHYGRR